MSATRIVLRPPTSNWDSTSCCTWVVPSQCADDGGCGKPDIVDRLLLGFSGAIQGPMMARIVKSSDSPRPILIFGDRGSCSIRFLRCRPGCGDRTCWPAVTGRPVPSGADPPIPAGPAPFGPGPCGSGLGGSRPRAVDIGQASWLVPGARMED